MIGAAAPAPGTSLSSAPLSSADTQVAHRAWDAPTTPARRVQVVDRSKVDPKLREAAEGMEAMFLNYLMKTMRQTVQKTDFDLENGATEIYRSMMDTETAQKAARTGGVGLADQIIAYLQTERYTQNQGQGVPATAAPMAVSPQQKPTGQAELKSSTGGTHESQPVR